MIVLLEMDSFVEPPRRYLSLIHTKELPPRAPRLRRGAASFDAGDCLPPRPALVVPVPAPPE